MRQKPAFDIQRILLSATILAIICDTHQRVAADSASEWEPSTGGQSQHGAGGGDLAGRGLQQRARQRRHGRGQDEKWLQHHLQLVQELELADQGEGFDVLFYGDSIMESTRGTLSGGAWTEFQPVKQAWDEAFRDKPYTTHALAFAGDTVKRLLWRVRNGELPKRKLPRVAVILIGTNDIVSPECTQPSAGNRTATELRGLLVYMHRRLPSTQLVAMGVLPKGQRWPNTCTPAITTVNSRLKAYARANADWLHFLDVGDQFLTHQDDGEGHQEIVPSLLTQDTLNPSFYGIRIIAKELIALIDDILDAQDSGAGFRGLWRGKKPKDGRKSMRKGGDSKVSKPRRSSDGGGDAKAARRQKAGRRKKLREKRAKAVAEANDAA